MSTPITLPFTAKGTLASEQSPSFYSERDRKNGYIIAHDRKGNEQKVPLLSISIGIVTNETRKIDHVAQVGEIGAELKSLAKQLERSNYVKDKRKDAR